MTNRARDITDDDLRRWSREAYPLLRGMSPRQVMSNRRKWREATQWLGQRWLLRLSDVHKRGSVPLLRVLA